MKLNQLYFENEDAEICMPLRVHLDSAKHNGLSEITLNPAIRQKGNSEFFWCMYFGFCGAKEEGDCGKHCNEYIPQNGKGGKCKWSSKPYNYGNEEKFSLINGKWKVLKDNEEVG